MQATNTYHLEYLLVFTKSQCSEDEYDRYILFNIWHFAHDSAVDTDTNFPLGFDNINIAKFQIQNRNRLVAFFGKRNNFCHVGRARRATFKYKHLEEKM
jgi:hypothetical protein